MFVAWCIGVVVLLLAAVGIAIHENDGRNDGRCFVAAVAAVVLAAYGGFGIYSYNPSGSDARLGKVLVGQYGFESGKLYPLEIEGGGDASSGSLAVVMTSSASYVLSFHSDDGIIYSWEVPASKVTRQIVDNSSREGAAVTLVGSRWIERHGGVSCPVKSAPYWRQTVPARDIVDAECRIGGEFGSWAEAYTKSVVINITEENYQSLLGRKK